ncbi:MAG: hypothetical protein KDJ22_01905, partial [Candidatus Competibacteraceae bacterium]|nr:hypothetical protein [Candidatus Competibacteraceae bacterium]
LGLDTDVGIWKYFRRHWPSWFPRLGSRTTFAQQAANLWVVKQRFHPLGIFINRQVGRPDLQLESLIA